ncbi:hypothetical protein AKJ36_00790 [candidate division MSBL1 archaeon SCGC-AAA259I07]|uniref:V-ATPase proteolipid subunit C-like domain-containing protein n=1 Tax=candidate division MSBL1 archaeon SCGC-AAA259I07 TaxID=1698266 RepID=A0A133UMH4_9EURY|nr:hypothetical protein AKJ36_00790 [candidate division MSBL1 archaeon SCGC-AAA259I07]
MEPIVLVGIAIGLAVGIPGILSALAVGMAGVSAAGVTAEQPERFGNLFVLQILPGTQGFYGFIAGVLIMIGTGILGGAGELGGLPPNIGMLAIVAAVPAVLQGFTAYWQSQVASASCGAVAKRPETFGNLVIYTVMPETYAILGFLAAFLLMISLGVF